MQRAYARTGKPATCQTATLGLGIAEITVPHATGDRSLRVAPGYAKSKIKVTGGYAYPPVTLIFSV
ncbi:hypothetical protein JCM9534A_24340 [Catenuloplanes indicus JCM 9534]